jgi:nicotinate (nicotinamide) nucleotide adenylyltransferase
MVTGVAITMVRTGILGSAFDPPHYAHAAMAMLALDSGAVDEVWLCPSPPRWDKSPIASLEDRIQWAEIMAQSLRALEYAVTVSHEETKFDTFRGSYVFFSHLKKSFPQREFFAIVGLDAWQSIPLWRDPTMNIINGETMRREFPFLVVPRDGTTLRANLPEPHKMLPSISEVEERYCALLGASEICTLSSSAVRETLSKNLPSIFCFESVENEVRKLNPYLRK